MNNFVFRDRNGVARNHSNILSRCSRNIGYLLPIELSSVTRVCTAVCILYIYSEVTSLRGSLVPICGFRARGEESSSGLRLRLLERESPGTFQDPLSHGKRGFRVRAAFRGAQIWIWQRRPGISSTSSPLLPLRCIFEVLFRQRVK